MKRKNPAAVSLGRRGGKSTSPAKAAAARVNGTRGGRPSLTHVLCQDARGVRAVCGRPVPADAIRAIDAVTCARCLRILTARRHRQAERYAEQRGVE
jgi:hypothetical protein